MVNASKDEDLYNDALNYFLKAEEKDSNDYFLLHRIGLLYLYSKNNLDIQKAENYFRKAAKYAISESHPDSARLFNILDGNVNEKFQNQELSQILVKNIAAESLHQASISCYVQGKFVESIELARRALEMNPKLLESGITLSKSFCAYGQVNSAIPVLSQVVLSNRYYALKIATDMDLGTKDDIIRLLEELKIKSLKEAKERYEFVKLNLSADNRFDNILKKIDSLIQSNKYLEIQKALDILNNTINHEYSGERYSILFEKNISTENFCYSPDNTEFSYIGNGKISTLSSSIGNLIRELDYGYLNKDIVYTSDGEFLVILREGDIYFCNLKSDELRVSSVYLGESFKDSERMSLSPDGKYLAVSGKYEACVIDIVSKKIINSFRTNLSPNIAFFNSGGNLLSIFDSKYSQVGSEFVVKYERYVYDWKNGKLEEVKVINKLPANELTVFNDRTSYGFEYGFLHQRGISQNGRYFAFVQGTDWGGICIWDIINKRENFVIPSKFGEIANFCFNPEGTHLLCSYRTSKLVLWDISLGVLNLEKFVDYQKKLSANIEIEKEKERIKEKIKKEKEEIQKLSVEYYNKGLEEESKQNKKWFGKDFSVAIQLFKKSAELGSENAKQKLKLYDSN